MAVAVMVIVIEVTVAVVVVMVIAVIITAAAVMAPGKCSEENPEKSSPRKKEKLSLGLPTQNKARVGVVGTLIDISPA